MGDPLTKALDAEIPRLAKSATELREIEQLIRRRPTEHRLFRGDARDLSFVADESVHLVVTSPPYWTLKAYNDSPDQLGHVRDYQAFLGELDKVWRESLRVLVPGGRLVVVVGDVCLSRRENGRHSVVPLHADIQVRCRTLGFDNLAPIIWYKIANAKFEAKGNGAGYLGKPYEPNGIVKNDIEFLLLQRKPGGYRKPTHEQRKLSVISSENFSAWFKQIWDIKGESTRAHPAPFPEELAERLVRMFSFAGDTVLDPFAGTGTTMVAACRWGRNSIGVEVDPTYAALARKRMESVRSTLVATQKFQYQDRLQAIAIAGK